MIVAAASLLLPGCHGPPRLPGDNRIAAGHVAGLPILLDRGWRLRFGDDMAWADPAYDLVHASIVACQENLSQGLAGSKHAETTGVDNYQTLRLVFGAYDSAATGQAINLDYL